MNKVKNNLRWNINELQDTIQSKFFKIQEEGRMPYAILMHPETYHSIVTSEEYRKIFMINFQSMNTLQLFHYKVVADLDIHLGEWELLVRQS